MKTFIVLTLLVILAGCTLAPAVGNPVIAPAITAAVTAPSTGKSDLDIFAGEYAPIALTRSGLTRLHLIDLSTGRVAEGFEPFVLPAGAEITASAASADGLRLALVSGAGTACQPYAGGSTCYSEADNLHLVDIAAWKLTGIPLAGGGFVTRLVFNPDGSRLALAYDAMGKSTLQVFDTSTFSEIARRPLDYQPELLAYVLGGSALAAYGSPAGENPGVTMPGSPLLELFAPEDLAPVASIHLEGLLSGVWCLENCSADLDQRSSVNWQPAVVLSPDGSRLYIIHADAEMLTTVDLAKHAVEHTAIDPSSSFLERILSLTAGVAHAKGPLHGAMKMAAISPDGLHLYLVANSFQVSPDGVQEDSTLQVIDLPGSRFLAEESLNPQRYIIALQSTADGRQLILQGYAGKKPLVKLVSAQDLTPSAELTGWEVTPGDSVLLGKRTVPAGSELAVIDPLSLAVLRTWQVDAPATWLPGR